MTVSSEIVDQVKSTCEEAAAANLTTVSRRGNLIHLDLDAADDVMIVAVLGVQNLISGRSSGALRRTAVELLLSCDGQRYSFFFGPRANVYYGCALRKGTRLRETKRRAVRSLIRCSRA